MAAYTSEEHRQARVRCETLLWKIYNQYGPKDLSRNKIRPFSADKYAAMTRSQIDAKWDFADRHLMHRIAKELVSP